MAATTGIDGMRMGAGMSNSRDSTFIATYSLKADLTTQFDRYNKIKTGVELAITDSRMNYALYDGMPIIVPMIRHFRVPSQQVSIRFCPRNRPNKF